MISGNIPEWDVGRSVEDSCTATASNPTVTLTLNLFLNFRIPSFSAWPADSGEKTKP